MKKIVVMGTLALVGAAAQAEGYVGASLGRGKMSMDCAQGATCKESVSVFKLYAGTRLNEASQIDVGVARLGAFEVAYVRTVNDARQVRTVQRQGVVMVEDEFDPGVLVPQIGMVGVPQRQRFSVDAIVMAPVFNAHLTNDLRVFIKPGLGFVTATVNTDVNGQGTRSDSSIRLKPYVALGLDYAVSDSVKIFGSADWLGYQVKGDSGTMRSVNLGAQIDF